MGTLCVLFRDAPPPFLPLPPPPPLAARSLRRAASALTLITAPRSMTHSPGTFAAVNGSHVRRASSRPMRVPFTRLNATADATTGIVVWDMCRVSGYHTARLA